MSPKPTPPLGELDDCRKTAEKQPNKTQDGQEQPKPLLFAPKRSLSESALSAFRVLAQNHMFYYVFLAHQGRLPDIEGQKGTVGAAPLAGLSPLAGDKRGYKYPLGGS